MNQDHVFFAAASTGAAISALAAIRTDAGGATLAQYHDDVTEELSLEAAVRTFKRTIFEDRADRYIVVGHNVDLDRAALAKHEECADLFKGRAWIDVSVLAWPLVYSDVLHARSLEALCSHHGRDIPHDLFSRVDAIAFCYFEMMKRYKIACDVEQGARKVGARIIGSLLSKVNT